MTIELEKVGRIWRADWIRLPGLPHVGHGATRESAVADLFKWLVKNSAAYNYLLKALDEPVDFVIVKDSQHVTDRREIRRYR